MRLQREDSNVFDDPNREPTRNRAELLGFVGQKPELRYSQRGEAVISWSLATHHWHRRDSRPIRTTDWHNIVAYGEMAEPCSALRPGQLVRAVGWLHTRSWKDRLGTPRERTEVVLTEVAVVQHRPPPHQLSLGLSRDADLAWHGARLVA
jgi:single-strand DNA-binding protein